MLSHVWQDPSVILTRVCACVVITILAHFIGQITSENHSIKETKLSLSQNTAACCGAEVHYCTTAAGCWCNFAPQPAAGCNLAQQQLAADANLHHSSWLLGQICTTAGCWCKFAPQQPAGCNFHTLLKKLINL